MKYKHIPSMAHNFAHSFVSLMNYVDDTYVVDEIQAILQHIQEPIYISFLEGVIRPATADSHVLQTASMRYRSWFSEHARRHNVDPASIRHLEISIARTKQGMRVVVEVTDDRGKTIRLHVDQTAL
jgi:hypothetical protein